MAIQQKITEITLEKAQKMALRFHKWLVMNDYMYTQSSTQCRRSGLASIKWTVKSVQLMVSLFGVQSQPENRNLTRCENAGGLWKTSRYSEISD